MHRLVAAVLPTIVLGLLTGLVTPVASAVEYDGPPEDYATSQPQTRCRDTARPGTRRLARWVNRTFAGGTATASVRPCSSGGTSEHKDGRAIDWAMDATKRRDRVEVRRFLRRLFAEDADHNPHARARRMGVMYLIWNDHIYAAYDRDHFAPRDYRACRRLKNCSPTLRHRDHVHISLSKRGARARTSWYTAR